MPSARAPKTSRLGPRGLAATRRRRRDGFTLAGCSGHGGGAEPLSRSSRRRRDGDWVMATSTRSPRLLSRSRRSRAKILVNNTYNNLPRRRRSSMFRKSLEASPQAFVEVAVEDLLPQLRVILDRVGKFLDSTERVGPPSAKEGRARRRRPKRRKRRIKMFFPLYTSSTIPFENAPPLDHPSHRAEPCAVRGRRASV